MSFKSMVTKLLAPLLFWKRDKGDPSDLMLPPFEALEELERRRTDKNLQRRIEEYLSNDIPDYFKNGPILYLARHVGTPNFETLRFIYLTRHLGLNPVISQDSKGLFVSQNHVKKALGKLPICRRLSKKDGKLNEQYRNVTIIDFNSADGKIFSEIKTLWGENLVHFHARLFSELKLEKVEFPDDAKWIDRHHRTNLLNHYKDLMSLFIAHGIFFENYNKDDPQERLFVKEVLRPACDFVKKRFGYSPLIVQIFPTEVESYHFWISYPNVVMNIVRESMHNQHLHTREGLVP